jgi:hypothetical protein
MPRRTGMGPGLAIRRKRQTGRGCLPSIDLRRARGDDDVLAVDGRSGREVRHD